MTPSSLHDAIRTRAERDAATFRDQHAGEEPNEKWLENSFTAALPLAKHDAGVDVDASADAELFTAYKSALTAALGMRHAPRPDSEADRSGASETVQQPTRGEG